MTCNNLSICNLHVELVCNKFESTRNQRVLFWIMIAEKGADMIKEDAKAGLKVAA